MDFNDDWGLMYVAMYGDVDTDSNNGSTVHRRCSSDVQMDADHEHPAGSRLRQREISAHQRKQQPVQNYPAQQWQAGNSVWSRPAIRIFATYAKWDENWGYSNTSGLQTKDGSGNGVYTSSRGNDSEVTFGAQMEVWW